MQTRSIHINGIVQGVGFRPFVARLARSLGIAGWVLNATDGVDIVASADAAVLDEFERLLIEEAPVAARIISFESHEVLTRELDGFLIAASDADASRETLISPDLATCPDCLAELFDPADRRYHYPFINCTNCGPRFTIIDDLPYDRPATSMAGFAMCPDCAREYADEDDRRYHAQPDACFACGPQLWTCTPDGGRTWADGTREGSDALIAAAAQRLRDGGIVAVKGLGGWHLACDATNEEAVRTLRERKRRPTKPLAIMVASVGEAAALCEVSEEEAELLLSPARPIVLLLRGDGTALAPSVAGELPEVGIMLPATPVQHLLMHQAGIPLVMTSGNRSGEPIVANDDEALDVLGHIADLFLGNNRAIVARYDDSVARVLADGSTQMVRRARGYAPTPLFVPAPATDATVFAAGPEQKATFAFAKENRIYLSQHLGDLETAGAWHAWEEAFERYGRLFGLTPDVLVCDMHPEYFSGKWARAKAAELGLPLVEVQHHHAHIAAVMGEHDLHNPVIGVALDGTGYGTDGAVWGGEILLASRRDFERMWHLPAFKLPGGAAAIRDPRRAAYSLLWEHGLLDDPRFADFVAGLDNPALLGQMLEKDLNSPVCTSAGRLFDAGAALMGLVKTAGYDGEPACLLEAQARRELLAGALPVPLTKGGPLTASGLHVSVAQAIIEECTAIAESRGVRDVALSGGCMVNRLLFGLLESGLAAAGLNVYTNRELPPNDGCIAYGQAIVARARLKEE